MAQRRGGPPPGSGRGVGGLPGVRGGCATPWDAQHPVGSTDRGGESLGALNLYSAKVRGFDVVDEQLVTDLCPATAAFIANAQAYWHAFDVTEQLNEALTSRSGIDQAIGVLMAGDPSLDSDAAFGLLRKASQRENIKLRDIARRIVERRTPPELDEETPV